MELTVRTNAQYSTRRVFLAGAQPKVGTPGSLPRETIRRRDPLVLTDLTHPGIADLSRTANLFGCLLDEIALS